MSGDALEFAILGKNCPIFHLLSDGLGFCPRHGALFEAFAVYSVIALTPAVCCQVPDLNVFTASLTAALKSYHTAGYREKQDHILIRLITKQTTFIE